MKYRCAHEHPYLVRIALRRSATRTAAAAAAPQTEQTSPALSEHTQMDHTQMDHTGMDHTGMDHAIHGATTRSAGDVALPPPTTAALAAAFPPLRTVLRPRHPWCLWSVSIGWKRGMLIPGAATLGQHRHGLAATFNGCGYVAKVSVTVADANLSQWICCMGTIFRPGGMLSLARRDEQPDGRTWAALGVQGVDPV